MKTAPVLAILTLVALNFPASAIDENHPVAETGSPQAQTSTLLIPPNATWRYLDDGSDLGQTWRTIDFDDSGWPAGPAELGYGDGDEATVIGFGDDVENRHITTYFRHAFTVDELDDIRYLKFWMRRDDGAVVYLNDQEVWRDNMREGRVQASTLARRGIGDHRENFDLYRVVPPSGLRTGANVIAVEIHQDKPISSDVSFNFSATAMIGDIVPTLTRAPYLQQATPTSAVVCWRTDIPTRGWVRYGLSPDALDQVVSEDNPHADHQLALEGLAPETSYFYAVGNGDHTLVEPSPERFVTTHPRPGSTKPVRIWVLGDSGTANKNARSVRDAYVKFAGDRPCDLALMLGDNAYDDGTDEEYQQAVFETYPDQLRNTVFWSTLGNHDGHTAFSASLKGPYYDIFHLPTRAEAGGAPSGTEAYYSFDYANIHFICLNSYDVDRTRDGAMYTWLKADLAQLRSEWVIAFWHHPPYSKGSHDSDTEKGLIDMREVFLPLLEEAGVDLVLGGHSHCYERSKLIHGHYGMSDTLTPAMIVDGNGGRPYKKPTHEGAVYTVAGSSGKISGGPLNHPVMEISLNELGSMVLDVHGNRLDATFIGATPGVGDRFSIVKPRR